jgi:predicted RNase H-like HicB family nuclease
MELTVFVHQERAGFWSEIKELPGCFASGRTLSELAEALSEAIGLCLGDQPARLEHEPLRVGELTARVLGT